MKERILEFLKAENKSSAQLAEDIGVQPSGISHILSGRNNPSLDFVIKMLEKYSFLSTDWLLFGKGHMYRDNSMHSLFEDDDIKKETISIQRDQDIKDRSFNSELIDEIKNEPDEKRAVKDKNTSVRSIIWFYDNNRYKEFFPVND
jgi:transcriptional regulator with XRE-family HTH domain